MSTILASAEVGLILENMNTLFYRPDIRDEMEYSEAFESAELNKPEVELVFRYLRKHDLYQYGNYQLDPKSGLCILCVLDFTNREVIFSWSLCDGDNFNKEISRNIAMEHFAAESDRCFSVPMPEGTSAWTESLTQMFAYNLPISKVSAPVRRFLKNTTVIMDYLS